MMCGGSLSPLSPSLSVSTGSVDLRYKLGLITHKYQLTHRNLADGYPHYVNITRHNRTIKTQVQLLSAPLCSHCENLDLCALYEWLK